MSAPTAPAQTPKPFPFLKLPLELRNAIYEHALAWPDLDKAFQRVENLEPSVQTEFIDAQVKRPPLCTLPKPHFTATGTPAIFLVNHQICDEARDRLYAKPWMLSSHPPYVPVLAKPMDITEFIGKNSLQCLRFVILELDLTYRPMSVDGSAKCWLKTIETLLDVWCISNQLERVTVRADYVEVDKSAGWTFGEAAHHRNVMSILSRLKGFGTQVLVRFEGKVPEERMKRKHPAQGQWYDVIDWTTIC